MRILEEEEKMENSLFIPIIILNILIIIIGLYLTFLFIKSKSFHTYPCYNMMIFSFILILDNVLRILPLTDNRIENHTVLEYIQAFFLVFFDKLILATLTMHALIFYLGVAKTKFYYDHESAIFITTFSVNFVISFAMSLVYIIVNDIHQSSHRKYYYCDDSFGKRLADGIFDSIYFSINLFCTIYLIIFISKRKKEAEKGIIEDLDYKHNFIRIIILFFLNFATFLESYLIIYGKLHGKPTDLIYLTTCLFIGLYNSINKIVYEETMKIFCKQKYKEKKFNKEMEKDQQEDEDENEEGGVTLQRVRTESF